MRRLTHRQALFCELRDILRLSPATCRTAKARAPNRSPPPPKPRACEPLPPPANATTTACANESVSYPARAAEQPPAAILLDYLERYAPNSAASLCCTTSRGA